MDFSQLTFDQRLAYALALADTNTVLPTAYRHNAGAILFAMEMGEAAGLANISAVLNGIHLIPDSSGDVKPTISVNMMTAAVLKHGFTLEETYDEATHTATVTLTRPAATGTKKQTYTSVWDEQRARRAHLWGSSMFWIQHTQEMLTNRAVAEVCRRHAADVLNGLIYTPEEISSDHEKKFAHAFAPVKAEIDYLKLDDEALKNLTGFTLDDLQSRTAEELATEILPALVSYEHERNMAETVDIKAEIEALSAALTGMSPGAKRALIKKCVAPSRTYETMRPSEATALLREMEKQRAHAQGVPAKQDNAPAPVQGYAPQPPRNMPTPAPVMQQPAQQPAAQPKAPARPPLFLSAAQCELSRLIETSFDYLETENLYADFGFAHPVNVASLDDDTVRRMLINARERLGTAGSDLEEARTQEALDLEEALDSVGDAEGLY